MHVPDQAWHDLLQTWQCLWTCGIDDGLGEIGIVLVGVFMTIDDSIGGSTNAWLRCLTFSRVMELQILHSRFVLMKSVEIGSQGLNPSVIGSQSLSSVHSQLTLNSPRDIIEDIVRRPRFRAFPAPPSPRSHAERVHPLIITYLLQTHCSSWTPDSIVGELCLCFCGRVPHWNSKTNRMTSVC